MLRSVRNRTSLAVAAAVLAVPVAAALAVAPDSTTVVARPPGFGALAAPSVNHSFAGAGLLGAQAPRLVSSVQGNRYVVFVSDADGLSPDDDDRVSNVYVRDRDTGRTLLASRADGPAGAGGDSSSFDAAISPDGRFVAFSSTATNLTATSVSGQVSHIYVRDILAGTTVLIDRASGVDGAVGNDGATSPSVTALNGGPVVAFASTSTNLTGVDPGAAQQIYVRRAGTTTIASVKYGTTNVPGNDSSREPSLSDDGLRVAFTSDADNLANVLDTNAASDVFIRDFNNNPVADYTAIVSKSGPQSDGDSWAPSIDADGSRVAFTSTATNMSGQDQDTPNVQDVFVWDQGMGVALASRASTFAGVPGSGPSGEPSLSGSGEWVAFTSSAPNLVTGDTNGAPDVFLRTQVFALDATASTSRPSRTQAGVQYDNASGGPSLASDGGYVAFTTTADNAGDTDDDDFVQVYGRPLGFTVAGPSHLSRPDGTAAFRSGVNTSSLRPRQRTTEPVDAMSADGRYTVFLSAADDLVPDDVNAFTNVYRRDNLTGETILVSRADGPAGAAADGPSAVSGIPTGGDPVGAPAISADGNRIVFTSAATNLVPGDANGLPDVFVRDVAAGTTVRASVKPDGSEIPLGGIDPAISGDGNRVAFSTRSTLDASDPNNGVNDVYLRDLGAGTTILVSRNGPAGPAGDAASTEAALDADGSHVAFTSAGTNFPDGGGNGTVSDVFVRDVAAGQTVLASRKSGAAGLIGDSFSGAPSLSDDGRRVAFSSTSTNLAPGDDNVGARDVFVRDTSTAQTLLASRTDGPNGVSPTGTSERPSISGDGTRVVFVTSAPDLVPGDVNGAADVALRDLAANTTTLLSRGAGAAGAQANAASDDPAISGDGNCVAFTTRADNLAAGQPRGTDIDTVVARALRGDCPFGPLPAPAVPAETPPATPGGAGSGQQDAADRTAPVVRGFRATPARFRAGTRVRAARRGRPATGTTLRFTLSEPGRATVTVASVLPGRRVRSRCVAPRPRLRGRACVRLVTRGSVGVAARSGANRIPFPGRLRGRLLSPGSYRAVIVVRDAAGNASRVRSATLTVLRPR